MSGIWSGRWDIPALPAGDQPALLRNGRCQLADQGGRGAAWGVFRAAASFRSSYFGVFCALDTILFFACWEFTLLPLYFRSACRVSVPGRQAAAVHYFPSDRPGDARSA